MRLKTFVASDLNTALKQVRKELGEEAVIVSTQESATEAKVMAAVEEVIKPPSSMLEHDPFHILDKFGQMLDYHGVPANISERLLVQAADTVGASDHIDLLCELFKFRPIVFHPKQRNIIMLVGQPGVGKSIAIAKLAAQSIMCDKTVQIITCDYMKAGAIHQQLAYAKVMNLRLCVAKNPQQLEQLIRACKNFDVILVDTPGINPFDSTQLKMLAQYIVAIGRTPVLVMGAGGDVHESIDIVGQFSRLGVGRMITTKIDATKRMGNVISCAYEQDIALSCFGVGPTLADSLINADANYLYHILQTCDLQSRILQYDDRHAINYNKMEA